MKTDYVNTIWNQIIQCQNLQSNDYKYSDLGFIMLRRLSKMLFKEPMDRYLDGIFISPWDFIQ